MCNRLSKRCFLGRWYWPFQMSSQLLSYIFMYKTSCAPHEFFCIIFTPIPEKWPLYSAIGHWKCIIFVVFQKNLPVYSTTSIFSIKQKNHKKLSLYSCRYGICPKYPHNITPTPYALVTTAFSNHLSWVALVRKQK